MLSMIRRIFYAVLVAVVSFVTMEISAQTAATHLPYFNGFEHRNNVLKKSCFLNTGPNAVGLTNKWYISGYRPYMGDSCMIISSDNGATASYNVSKTNSAVAYIDVSLLPGSYDLSFAWSCLGEADKDGLYVCFLPQSTPINSSLTTMSPLVKQNALRFGIDKKQILAERSSWQIAEALVTVPGSGTVPVPYRIYFVWSNDGANGSGQGAIVDNVQLSHTACGKPADLRSVLRASSVELSWIGNAASYEVMYRAYGQSVVNTFTSIAPQPVGRHNVTIPNISEGVYDFYVRGICPNGDTTIWTGIYNKLIYLKENHCIDYLNLDEATCTKGTYHNPWQSVGKVDHGPENLSGSYHTVHFLPGETDVYTLNELTTVPPNGIASVRIGNDQGGDAASVTYEYTLGRTEEIIMMVNYAIVYESPNHPTESEQPNFQLEILDSVGNLINTDGLRCNEAYFYPPTPGQNLPDATWHQNSGEPWGKDWDIVWKDWTSMGINLTPFKGKTIKIRLTVRDCVYTAHFAHAYFSIDCASAKLEGYSCGEVADFGVSAPEGFDYKWYRQSAPEVVLSTERDFSIPATQADTFHCDVILQGKEGLCYFTLPAYLVPRVPLAKFTPQHIPHDCQNWLTLRNTSGVLSDGKLTNEQCETHRWDITDLSTGKVTTIHDSISPELLFPDRGDTIMVELLVGISNNQCTDYYKIDTVIIPPIGPSDTTVVATTCRFPYRFCGQLYRKAGIYSNRDDEGNNKSYAGCDSIFTLDLRYVTNIDTTIYKTICEGDTFVLKDQNYTRTSPAEGYSARFVSSQGCDSTVILHLSVRPQVDVVFDSLAEICAFDPHFDATYTVLQGDPRSYNLRFDAKALEQGFEDADSLPLTDNYIRIPLPQDTLRPDFYSVEVSYNTDSCGVYPFTLPFMVQYPSDKVFVQKWNDVLALLNKDHNYGRFEYSFHQWYKNDQPIPGAVGSYLYIGKNGETFESGDAFRVELLRVGDSIPIMSCPLIPVERTDVQQYILLTSVQASASIPISQLPADGVARWYMTDGRLMGESSISSPDDSIPTPPYPGVYILQLVFPDRTDHVKVVVN